jgi:hypothetical protein
MSFLVWIILCDALAVILLTWLYIHISRIEKGMRKL